MVTGNPAGPELAERLPIVARATTVKGDPLLAGSPGTVTTTLPVVAPVGTGTVICESLHKAPVAVVPLNLTVLEPCIAPNPLPTIIRDNPTEPDVCERKLILGGGITVKLSPLLTAPVGLVTTTFPVEAVAGTGTEMLVGPQLDGVAGTPPKVTVLPP